jgi:SPP1 gp7 family putative phage head morphogenesis protein
VRAAEYRREYVRAQIKARRGKVRLRKVVPRQRPANAVEAYYATEVLRIVALSRSLIDGALPEILQQLEMRRRSLIVDSADQDTHRQDDLVSTVRQIMLRVRTQLEVLIPDYAVHDMTRTVAQRTAQHQRRELERQMRSVVGVDILMTEPWLAEHIEMFAAANTRLIKHVPYRLLDEIEQIIGRSALSGESQERTAERIRERADVSESSARRIARDQVGKLQGQINGLRQRSLGITSYTWRTSGDWRVRDEHAALEGRVIAWADPPPSGHPGEAIQCRCTAEPRFEELLSSRQSPPDDLDE